MTAPADSLVMGFEIAPRVARGAGHNAYEQKPDDPRWRPLRIYALDPTRFRDDGAIAVVNVPYEPVEAGPIGALLAVENDELPGDESIERLALDDPRLMLGQGRDPSATDPAFRAQMVYAVCHITYAAFKRALGRDVMWGFDRQEADGAPARLIIKPSVDGMRNAFYDPARGELRFGIFRADDKVEGLNVPGGVVSTALIHDVVVHEMSHAMLDGLRAKFMIPTAPDVTRFTKPSRTSSRSSSASRTATSCGRRSSTRGATLAFRRFCRRSVDSSRRPPAWAARFATRSPSQAQRSVIQMTRTSAVSSSLRRCSVLSCRCTVEKRCRSFVSPAGAPASFRLGDCPTRSWRR